MSLLLQWPVSVRGTTYVMVLEWNHPHSVEYGWVIATKKCNNFAASVFCAAKFDPHQFVKGYISPQCF